MKLDFTKGLIPVIIQDNNTLQVLMLGYMNEEALLKTQEEQVVTFYSRSKQRLWTKGESSGNSLHVVSIDADCDCDTILIRAIPKGPTCHLGTKSCFNDDSARGFLYKLESVIEERINSSDDKSYTLDLFNQGIAKCAQKVGEEAVETVIEAMKDDDQLFKNETADLLYHLIILLKSKGVSLIDIEEILLQRNS